MNEAEVRQWYEANGMEYLPGDWDERSDTGESASYQPQSSERHHMKMAEMPDQDRLAEMEDEGKVMLLWEQREDHEVLEALEEFFAPYMSSMPHAKRRVLEEFMMDRKSQSEIAGDRNPEVTQQAVSKQIRAAVRWAVKAIADDTPGAGLYDDEELAWVAFNEYWEGRFGTPWPLRG
jgi:hypothetical protein